MKRLLPLACCLLLPALAAAQESTPDPFAPAPTSPAPVVDKNPPLRLRLETWEAPALEVARKLDEVVTAKDLANLREQCLNGAPGVSLVMSNAITFATPSKVTAESITERIYPTEYEPPALPCAGIVAPSEKQPAGNWREIVDSALQDVTPTSFETRNTGQLRLKEGEWQILSVMEPPRGLDNQPSDKRWVTLVRVDPSK